MALPVQMLIRKKPQITNLHPGGVGVKGFTLIELLVVISIIGVLAALVVVNYSSARTRARDLTRKSDLAQIKRALRLYYNDNSAYPDEGDFTFGAAWETDENMTYMRLVPDDPLDGSSYQYFHTGCSEGDHDFRLVAVLENKSDAEAAESQARCGTDCGYDSDNFNDDQYVVCAD